MTARPKTLLRRSFVGLLTGAPVAALAQTIAPPPTRVHSFSPREQLIPADYAILGLEIRRIDRGQLDWMKEPPYLEPGFLTVFFTPDSPHWLRLEEALRKTKVTGRDGVRPTRNEFDPPKPRVLSDLNRLVFWNHSRGRAVFAFADKPVRVGDRDLYPAATGGWNAALEGDFPRVLAEMERDGLVVFGPRPAGVPL